MIIRSKEYKRKMSLAKKGHAPTFIAYSKENPFFGKKHSLESKDRISKAKIGKKIGEENSNWKGDGVSYDGLHKWINRHMGKADHCDNNFLHSASRYYWANISGEYKRDPSDWHQLCPSCNKLDGIKKHSRFLRGGAFA